MSKSKIVGKGYFNSDIYSVTGRYPLDYGENLTKNEIDSMFEIIWKKGTKLELWNEGKFTMWYTEDGDGGWLESDDSGYINEWTKNNITRTKK